MIYAVLLMAGKGTRCQTFDFKQYEKINNIDLFLYPLNTLLTVDDIDNIVLVVDNDHFEYVNKTINNIKTNKNIYITIGGSTRKESVYNALKYIDSFNNCEYVLIHDAARFLISKEIILNSLSAVKKYNATTCYIDAIDTIALKKDDKYIDKYLNREKIIKIQTPQCFKFDIILKAHQELDDNYFDDCSLINKLNKDIYLVKGDEKNFKVTTQLDLHLGEILVNKNEK